MIIIFINNGDLVQRRKSLMRPIISTLQSRSAAKTATYALMHFAVAFTITLALTGDWRAAASIGFIEPLAQTFFYRLHEAAWMKRNPAFV